ncbi:MAG: U32 family peptidase [Oscillospiraceae bacterium]|nr:U32 family peptidase [Oscillospiraceae bacterium]
MLEILAPAGSPEGVIAAVQNGADAVYMGFGGFNARINAKNFTPEDFEKAAEYCRIRDVKTYVTLNTLATDRELTAVAEHAKLASRLGADAVLVQDLGVLRAVKDAAPELPVHASTQMSIHNLEGVKLAAALGMTRVVLARELSRDEIAFICENSPIEIEVFVHGALCMCYSGQCYMSSVIGRRSGNRGLCAQPCRLNYSTTGHDAEYLLSLRDSCLVEHLGELEEMGVSCIKIEGRMKRPEYAAIVTGIYSRALKEKRQPTKEELDALRSAFSRQGFTQGYYNDKKGPEMFGRREEADKGSEQLFSAARRGYMNGENQRVPVRFIGMLREGTSAKVAVVDKNLNYEIAEGPYPEPAEVRELTAEKFGAQLRKTGGTPYFCENDRCTVDPGLTIPMAAINDMRRRALSQLSARRALLEPRELGEFTPAPRIPNRRGETAINIQVLKTRQLSAGLAQLQPSLVYFPLEEIKNAGPELWNFTDDPLMNVAVIVPRIIHDDERNEVSDLLKRAKDAGITEALVGNLGHIMFVRRHGFDVRGDFGLNIFNSDSLDVVKLFGLKSQTLSFELRFEQLRDISKCMDTELITYGRLPLMITENCIIKNTMKVCSCDSFGGINDRMGANFPVVKSFGCRNTILNSKKLFLADKLPMLNSLGLWAQRLVFTTENDIECVNVLKSYKGLSQYSPGGITRGLYVRGVE